MQKIQITLSLTLREHRLLVFKNSSLNFIKSDQIKDQMGGAYGREINAYTLWWGKLKERDHLEHLAVQWGITLTGS
jgi:hypothetical protein